MNHIQQEIHVGQLRGPAELHLRYIFVLYVLGLSGL